MVFGFASSDSLAIIGAGAIENQRRLPGGSDLAGSDAGLGSVRATLQDARAAEQPGHGGGSQNFFSHILRRHGHNMPWHLWQAAFGMFKQNPLANFPFGFGSPSSIRGDLHDMKALCARFGVKEYWVSDPNKKQWRSSCCEADVINVIPRPKKKEGWCPRCCRAWNWNWPTS